MVIHTSFVRNVCISATSRVTTQPFIYQHVWTLMISNSFSSMTNASLASVIHLSLTYPHAGLYLGQITSRNWLGTQNQKHPNRDMQNFFGRYANHGDKKDAVEMTLCISSWIWFKLAYKVGYRKKSLEQNDCLHVASVLEWRVRKSQLKMSLICKITFKQIVEVLFQYF